MSARANIVTFYSYKGGVGRSFVLSSVAVLLAQWNRRVLCIDWDLEAPGLSHYLRPWMRPGAVGIVDMMESLTSDPRSHAGGLDWRKHVVSVQLPGDDTIDLIPSGSRSEYTARVQAIDWEGLYDSHDLGNRLERFRQEIAEAYDVVLIDSRTGISDTSRICTVQLPDILAVVFTANLQSLEGTLDVAKRLSAARDALPVDRKGLPIVPILSRFDAREEKELGDRWLTRVAEALGPLYSPWLPASVQPRQILERTLIPYVSYWSFGEKLPPLEESAGNPETIAWSLESIAALVANGLGNITELIRNRDQFVSSARLQKHQENISHDVFVSHAPREGRVAVQIADGLRSLGRRVFLEDPDLESAVHDPATSAKTLASSRHLLIIVRNELSRMQEQAIRQFVVGLIDRTIDSRVVVLRTGDSTVPLPPVLSSFPLVRLDPAVERTAQTLDKALGMSTVHEGDVRTQLLTLLRNRRDQLAARGSVGTQWITQIRSLF